jgi:hypothetical protein
MNAVMYSAFMTTEWHAPIAAFARESGYVFDGDLAFCTIKAPAKGTTVDVWISRMGPGRPRATLAGTLANDGVVHCRAKAKLVAKIGVEVRRKTLLDRAVSRGHATGDAEFDSKYVALGKPDEIRRVLDEPVRRAFVEMWRWTEGLCIEDDVVAVEGGELSLHPSEIAFIIDAVSTIAAAGVG